MNLIFPIVYSLLMAFSDWLFRESVEFLLSLEIFGWNYVVSSVLVCVVFPAIVFAIMLRDAYPGFFPALLGMESKQDVTREGEGTN